MPNPNYAIPGLMGLETPKADDDAIHIALPEPGLDISKLATTGTRTPSTVLYGDAVWRSPAGGLSGLRYQFNSGDDTLTDPGEGSFNLDDADDTLATTLVISCKDSNIDDQLSFLTTWDTGGTLTIRQLENPNIFRVYAIRSNSHEDQGGGVWALFDVTYIGGDGEFEIQDPCDLSFSAGSEGRIAPGTYEDPRATLKLLY
jgi:hypothetical protein